MKMIRGWGALVAALFLAAALEAAPEVTTKSHPTDPTDVNRGSYYGNGGYYGGGYSGGGHYGGHSGYHNGDHSGSHYGDHSGSHYGGHSGYHNGGHSGNHDGYHSGHGGYPVVPWSNRATPN